MKAVAVKPKTVKSVHLVEMEKPRVSDIKNGRGVLVELLRVGACGTDREINNGEYGVAPKGFDFLVLGHENFGRIVEIGKNVKEFAVGDFVVATVRRPFGHSIYDTIGQQDFTTDDEYWERGISRLHGYMAEFYSESADFLVKIPPKIAEIGVLLEPLVHYRKRFETSGRYSTSARHLATENGGSFGNRKCWIADDNGFADAWFSSSRIWTR